MFQLQMMRFLKSRLLVNQSIPYVSLGYKIDKVPGTLISLFIVTLPTCQVNTSITVDDEAPTVHSFRRTKTTYNVQLYSSTTLPFGNHSIHVDLLDLVNTGVNNTSCLFFDYAVINDALDGASCSTTSTAGSSTCIPIDQHPL